MNTISIKDFQKLDLRIGKIAKVDDHPNADKLLVLTVDLEMDKKKTIVAGLKQHYTKKKLEGKKALFITNIEPVTVRGVVSEGMILAAVSEDKTHVVILEPEQEVATGTSVQ